MHALPFPQLLPFSCSKTLKLSNLNGTHYTLYSISSLVQCFFGMKNFSRKNYVPIKGEPRLAAFRLQLINDIVLSDRISLLYLFLYT